MDFKELPTDPKELGPRFHKAIETSHTIGPAAEFIANKLHGGDLIKAGEKWTLTMAMSCGYHLEMEFRIHHLGDCAPPEEQGPASEKSVIFGVRKDGVKIPFVAPSITKIHRFTGRPERQ